jgi:hypothetical protein
MGFFVDENDVGHWQRQQSKRTGGGSLYCAELGRSSFMGFNYVPERT